MAAFVADEVAQFKQSLEKRRQLLLEEIRDELARSGEQHYVDLAGRVPDLGDASVADMLADLGAAMADRQVIEVRAIEAALNRLAAGDYGVCVDCGADIPFDRLQAYPTAERCISCQSIHELAYAHEGHPTL
ncbi:TraR/DksA family transcriptional regulator [Sulfuricella denitrificans skB26]|uniref:TraR/DksA family transcriptional regulator n=1 Tax=Sulfuricella denitrificans (strain DSM 22764 / NBRC 105220 / skB26) TaxID=1163617 RepID=S6ABL7_SULDS|nr:TraR/DksA family transcriptional regulator [Sulfuricella denitrificans]BAN34818.1 TraR/DksA family transcriptional regulator [Sulfuricella denitrificans skB26]